jgi:GH25 family lysozyme M1 (1,4-beta-N-acetylmuramidase)
MNIYIYIERHELLMLFKTNEINALRLGSEHPTQQQQQKRLQNFFPPYHHHQQHMFKLLIILFLSVFLSCNITSVEAVRGLDLSVYQGEVSISAWRCLRQSGYEFAIVQAYQSKGVVNPYVVTDIARAREAGFKYIDIYIFPDFHKGIGSAASQVKEAVDFVRGHGQNFGMLWIDIEGPEYWGKCADNIAFLRAMVAGAEKMGVKLGIYTSKTQWDPIGCGSTEFSRFPLWYPHYDNNPSFSDFRPFGGWTKPSIKQYTGTTSICGTQIDQNFY